VGVTKQAVHKALDMELKTHERIGYLKALIDEIRQDHPTMSLRDMYYKICPQGIGRDRFERLAQDLGYSVERKCWTARTTDSSGVERFDNLLSGINLTKQDQAWSSDITYYWVGDRFYYLTFIIDCFTRRIVGYSTSSDLTTQATTLASLRMGVKTRRLITPGLILHSDGGGQYYSKEFLKLTESLQIRNSMCEKPYDNGKAERINGIIKNNYLRHWKIETFQELKRAVDRAVRLYNHEKPHKKLRYRTPIDFENQVLNLAMRTKPKMTKSFDAKLKITGASSPGLSSRTKPQNRNVFSAN